MDEGTDFEKAFLVDSDRDYSGSPNSLEYLLEAIEDVRDSRVSADAATINVTVRHATPNTKVYLRRTGSQDIHVEPNPKGKSLISIRLKSLTPDKKYQVRVALNEKFDAMKVISFTTKSAPNTKPTRTTKPIPRIKSVSLSKVGTDEATVDITVINATPDTSVYVRRIGPTGARAKTNDYRIPEGKLSIRFRSLEPRSDYQVEAALDESFESATTASFTTRAVAAIEDITVEEVGIHTARVSVNVADSTRDTGVFLRYGSEARGWVRTETPTRPVRGTARFALGEGERALSPGSDYEVEAALDPKFRSVTEQSRATFTTRATRWRMGLGVVVVLSLLVSVMYLLIKSRDAADSDPVDALGASTMEAPAEDSSTTVPDTTVPAPEKPVESVLDRGFSTSAPSTAALETSSPEVPSEVEQVPVAELIASECGAGYLSDLDPKHELSRWEVVVMLALRADLEWEPGVIQDLGVGREECWIVALETLAQRHYQAYVNFSSGYSNTDAVFYRAEEPATRAEVARLLRPVFYPDRDLEGEFRDFEDIDEYELERDVNILLDKEVTKGCTTEFHYCPEDPITKEQMETFLDRALGVR